MPRRAFVADLGKAVNGVSIAGISEVQTGGDDGEFTFQCVADGKKLKVSALIPDLSEYPSSHTCMIFAPDDAPASVATTLANISELASAKTVVQVLELVSRKLESTDRDGDKQMLDSQTYSDGEFENSDSEVDEYFPDEDMVPRPITNHMNGVTATNGDSKSTLSFRERIRSDLLTAKACGFKVGHHGGLMEGLGCYVSLSCRISKLGISEEAMQAWQVEPSEYLVVIFHYPTGYKSMDSIKSYDATTARRHLGIRVGISGTYKPSMQEAVRAFTVLSKEGEKRQEEQQRREEESPAEAQLHTLLRKGFRSSFISRPLNGLLEERFSTLLNYRYNGMPWSGAEMFYNEHYGINNTHLELGLDDKYLRAEQVSVNYPALVTADHICETTSQYHSLPLVGMQFVLRHFVRCTEFCLICFSKMPDDLQAIKPYVCENPLCLYQYMSLGFGPSIEHEILSQPQVVDLLISFCYASARMGKLKDFPIGLSLAVPPNCAYQKDHNTGIQQNGCGYPGAMPAPPIGTISTTIEGQPTRYNAVKREIIFGSMENRCPLRLGDWIVLQTDTQERALLPEPALHCRVADTSCYPAIKLSEPVYPMITNGLAPANRVPPPTPQLQTTEHALLQGPSPSQPLVDEYRSAKYYVYDQNFEELDEHYKREVVVMLLNILPSVADMKQYLSWKAQSPLSSWVDRIPPAALGLLRWIIASNRACIVQVESEGDDSGKIGEERLCGMSGWSQFRFAMGAPDKERRFLQAVRDTTQRLRLDYPTLFAWHGSPLANWHSIIREGLHFKDTSHGRAYGHGVYHSLDLNTSLGYSAWGVGGLAWPRSELMVTQALALNEIVNAPKEYVSRTPHLVVAQLDWIQTRYLFVKTATGDKDTAFKDEVKPSQCIPQDPSMTPRGVGSHLIIPLHCISATRRSIPQSLKNTYKRRKIASGKSIRDPIDLDADDDDDAASIATLEEDRMIFENEDIYAPQADPLPTPNSTKGKSAAAGFLSKVMGSKSSKPLTDFVPGTLDYSTLPMLESPIWATSAATKRLMRDFQDLLNVQSKEPAHELGWYIDPERVDNMYQWIVELHSFDPALPLAKDMKAKECKSVVLELRFGNQYPMSPPFVRVIRPRFLGFQQGGGGHVTAGGAMCMQLLTNDGWTAVTSIESVLLQVRMAISSTDPRPARLESNAGRSDYGVGEAIDAYIRACATHGWRVPDGFREMAMGGAATGAMY